MEKDDFIWLQNWYQTHCDGGWEHSRRIRLGTLDNPGWSLTINVQETELQEKAFPEVEIKRSENDWIFCSVKENKFDCACGPINLPEVLKLFRNWAENYKKS
jgi:hypothetical protein